MFDSKLIPFRPTELVARMNDLRAWRVPREGNLKEFHRGVLQTLTTLKYMAHLDVMEVDPSLQEGLDALRMRRDLMREARRVVSGFMLRLGIRTAIERSPVVGQKLEDSRDAAARNLRKLESVLERSLRDYGGADIAESRSEAVGATLL